MSELDRTLGCIDEAFEAETRLHLVAERIRRAMGATPGTDADPRAVDAAVEAFRCWLDARLSEPRRAWAERIVDVLVQRDAPR